MVAPPRFRFPTAKLGRDRDANEAAWMSQGYTRKFLVKAVLRGLECTLAVQDRLFR